MQTLTLVAQLLSRKVLEHLIFQQNVLQTYTLHTSYSVSLLKHSFLLDLVQIATVILDFVLIIVENVSRGPMQVTTSLRIGGENRGAAVAPLKRPLHRNIIFAIDNHYSLASGSPYF